MPLLLELLVCMSSNLRQVSARQSTSLGRMWIMITNMITIYWQEREIDWDKDILGLLTTPSKEGLQSHPLAYLVWEAVTCGRRRYDPEEYQSLDNRYYCPPHATSTSPSHPMHRPWRGHSSSRSRSGSPQSRGPPSPQVSTPPDTPPPPYSPSVANHMPSFNQRGPPIVRSKTRDLPSILVANPPQWKARFEKVPDLHKRFLMEVCSLIVNTAALTQFAKGCGISDYTISRAAMDNLGNDGECIKQALCRWWMSSNTHP